MSPVLELDRVSRTFGAGVPVTALLDATLAIGEGEHVAVVGPSGSGKSTMLGLLGCLDTPTSGNLRIDGHDVGRMTDAERTMIRRDAIGFVFQQFHLIPHVSAIRNVETALLFRGLAPRARTRMAASALVQVGLAARLEHLPGQLSGGEQQRVAIARAIVTRPRLLLADEPTGNLDSVSARGVLELLSGLVARTGTTLVIVTHDPAIGRTAGRRITLLDGRIVRDEIAA